MNEVHFMSKTNEWATPDVLFAQIAETWGPFTLDPCATEENAKCKRFYTMQDDGLSQSWQGESVFMNPPYGRQISKWIEKAYHEVHKNNGITTRAVCLIPARTDTSYWHDYVMRSDEICLIRGRVCFEGGGGGRAPFPSCVVVFESCTDGVPHLSTLEAVR